MKVVGIILKVLAVLAAITGVVYLVATYGDKVVAWFKRLLGKKEEACECCCDCEECECDNECECCCECEEVAEEAAEEVAEEAAEAEVVAAEADFEE